MKISKFFIFHILLGLSVILPAKAQFVDNLDSRCKNGSWDCREPLVKPWKYRYNVPCDYKDTEGEIFECAFAPIRDLYYTTSSLGRACAPWYVKQQHSWIIKQYFRYFPQLSYDEEKTYDIEAKVWDYDRNSAQYVCGPAIETSKITIRRARFLVCPDGYFSDNSTSPTQYCYRPLAQQCPHCPTDGAIVGNPILPATGEKYELEKDYLDHSVNGVHFERTWLSGRTFGISVAKAQPFGSGWRHSYQYRLNSSQIGDPTEANSSNNSPYSRAPMPDGWAVVQLPSGENIYFIYDKNGKYRNPARPWLTLDVFQPDIPVFVDEQNNIRVSFNNFGYPIKLLINGVSFIYDYNSNGTLSSITDSYGRKMEFEYNSSASPFVISSVITPDFQKIKYYYKQQGEDVVLTAVHREDIKDIEYLYENSKFPNLITKIFRGDGTLRVQVEYDDYGKAISTAGGMGANLFKVNYGYDKTARPGAMQSSAEITDPLGTLRKYQYQNNGPSLTVVGAVLPPVSAQAAPIRTRYINDGLVDTLYDQNNSRTENVFDKIRRLPIKSTSAAGKAEQVVTATEWHPTFRLPLKVTETGAQGGVRVTEYTYDERGNRLSETVSGSGLAAPITRSWTYTPLNLLASETDERGAVTTHSYDQWGNRISTTDPLGRVTQFTHDAAGRVLTQTDPSGVLTTNTYDLRGRLLTQTVGGLTTTMTYLPTGLLSSVTQPSGYRIDYTYDAAHRLTGWQDNRGASGQYVLDGMGNRTSEQTKDAAGNIAFELSRSINSINRVASETVGGSQSTSYSYDANGDLIGMANGLSQRTAYTLDGLRRQTAEKNPLNAQASLSYNSLDALTQAKDFKGVATSYSRDAEGNATQETSPDIGSQSTSFDARGLSTATQDAQGRSQSISRDAVGRPTQITASDGTGTASTSLGYEPASGQLKQITDPGLNTHFERDSLGRTTHKSQAIEATP